MRKSKILLMLSLTGLLTVTAPVMPATAKWKTTSEGKIYTKSGSPGYVTGFKKIGKYTYYFDKNGIMQTGVTEVSDKYYYFNSKGRMITGWITNTEGKKYYADSKGVLACDKWIDSYYFQEDCVLAVNTWVEGKWVGPDGKFTGVYNNVGFITKNGITFYYDENHRIVTGWVNTGGKTYYLQSGSGQLLKGWITVSGKSYYAEPKKGVIQKSAWIGNKYVGEDGVMVTGLATIGGKTYLFDSSGTKQTGWKSYDNKIYYLSKTNGILQKNKWISKKYYVLDDGSRASGFTDIAGKTYYFDPEKGNYLTKWQTIDGKKYYFSSSKGVLQKNRWVSSKKYYASGTGAMLTGLSAVENKLYYFDPVTAKKVKNKKITIGADTYYFQSGGAAAKSKWITIDKKYYYFGADGKMAKGTWVEGYYVDLEGVRSDAKKDTGWVTSNGVKYYFDKDGNMLTGWQTISNKKYYFSATGAMLTGIQTIGSAKYYFDSSGKLSSALTIIIGAKQYTINKNGKVTKEESLKLDEKTLGDKIVNFALQYVGNRYVYGGTSLTNGADCSGFVQTVFANFDIKLLRVADDQMKGPGTSNIKAGYKAAIIVDMSSLMPGDLIFYGTSGYASHVAIYIGNGKIVHASNSQPYPQGGIKISTYNYQTPVRAVRYWS